MINTNPFFCRPRWKIFFFSSIFLSFKQKLIHLPLVYWLTDSLVCPHKMLLKTWPRLKNHTLAKLLQEFRQKVTWPTLLGGNNMRILLKEYFANNNTKLKTINLFIVLTLQTWWESPTRREKKICKSIIQVCPFLKNLYFLTFNWHLQNAKKNSVSLFEAFSQNQGLLKV